MLKSKNESIVNFICHFRYKRFCIFFSKTSSYNIYLHLKCKLSDMTEYYFTILGTVCENYLKNNKKSVNQYQYWVEVLPMSDVDVLNLKAIE